LIAVPKKSLLVFGKNVVVNADEVEQLLEIHNTISRLSNNTLTSDEDRKAAESERQAAEQLRQNQEQLIQQEAERITREAVRKSQRERKEYEKKQAECEKLKADCEMLKKNLGHFIRQKSIELIKKAFPEIEQKKLAAKVKKLDEAARQNFTMNPGDEDKQY
jgi:membrane protein involved in colicin uptake